MGLRGAKIARFGAGLREGQIRSVQEREEEGMQMVRVMGQMSGMVDVENLTGGPLWERLVLEQSWMTASAVVVVCAVGALVALRAGKGRAAAVTAVGGIVIAAGIALAGVMVETTRERLVRQTREFVESMVAGRTGEVGELVEAGVRRGSAGEELEGGREMVVGLCAALPGVIRDSSVRTRGAEVTGVNVARSRVTVRAAGEGMMVGEAYSSWDLRWRRDTDGAWQIAGIECISVFGREPGREWIGMARRLAGSRGSGE